jgi:hypothetical protein
MKILSRRARAVATVSLVVGGLAVVAQPAHATFHEMKIREVFAGRADQPNAHFVELQMYSSGQNFVSGKQVKVFSAAGSEVGSFTFPGSVPNGANQASILVGTPEIQTAFGIVPDLTMTPVIAASGGKACFVDPGDYINPGQGNIDCVSWGSFAPGGETGTPAPAIPSEMSIERKISRGDPAILDSPADDTNNSMADFQATAPSPRNNSGAAPPPSPGTDTTAPASDIGKPAPGKTYNDSTFKKFRGSATDSGGLALVEIALRQKLANGCKWWNGNRFVSGGCNSKKFKKASGLATWTYALSKRLKPSNEGNIRFYTLYARATDAAGNVEAVFQKGRNANRFEVV